MNTETQLHISHRAQVLLDKLVKDYSDKLGPNDCHCFKPEDSAALIYNLFRGNYEFSAKEFKELFNYLKNTR